MKELIDVNISVDDYININIDYDNEIVFRYQEINIRALFFHY